MYRHLLVPVDNSDAGVEALGLAIEFAQVFGARITFLYVLPPSEAALGGEAHRAVPLGSVEARASELRSKVEAAARAQGVPCASACAIPDGGPGQAIIAAAHEHRCDLICVSSDSSVLAADDIAVLSFPADRKSVAARAIGRLLDEHRALADALHAWFALVRAAVASGVGLEAASMREVMLRFRDVHARLHRPKEERWFYAKLRERTSAVEAELGELELQHERDEQAVGELFDLVEHASANGGAPVRLEQALGAYAQFVWEHMGREEGVVLPAARRYLSDLDWHEIDAALRPAVRQDGLAADTDTTSGPGVSQA